MNRRIFILLGSAWSATALARKRHGHGQTTPPATVTVPASAPTALTPARPLADLVRLANTSASPNTFEGTLIAARANKTLLAGKSTEFWTYNGLVPGPVIEVFEGDMVRIRLENHLSQETTVHWHGLPVPPGQDGSPLDPVAPGASRTYEFTLPMGSAGTYWYHPHPHMHTAEQVFRGMAGLFIVRSRSDPVAAGIDEKLLVISDLRLAVDGSIPPDTTMDWQNGREGNYVLVNGQYRPTLGIRPGQSQRWRILNATNARYLRLALTGHTFTLIGTDGGLLQSAVPGLDEILLVPGQRVEVIVTGGATAGASATLQSLPYERGAMGMGMVTAGSYATLPLLSLSCTGTADVPVATPTALRPIAPLGVPAAYKHVVLGSGMAMVTTSASGVGMGMGMGMSGSGGMMRFLIDGKSFDPARVDLTSRVNRVEQWTVENRSGMDHPFHLHGTQVQVVSRARGGATVPEAMLAWRDVVNVAAFESVVFNVVQSQVGLRMYHCHILEHEDQGMMGVLAVVP